MSEHFFGSGAGWLSKRADAIARKHGASLVNYTDAQCLCGRGCGAHMCVKSRRHWFACQNLGAPHNENRANAVMAELSAAGIEA